MFASNKGDHVIFSLIIKLLILVGAWAASASGGFCAKRIVNGRWISEGNCEVIDADSIFRDLKERVDARKRDTAKTRKSPGSISNPAKSCLELKQNSGVPENKLYYINTSNVNIFQTYCDMTVDGGGWTLVASVHENDVYGRCTPGDRWSSERGDSADHPHGDGFWENNATYGTADNSTNDDYKNPAYFTMNASDVMIWHVTNKTPLEGYESGAIIKYHTATGFLQNFGGNLGSLFSKHFLMRSKQFTTNGPAIPIVWDKGNNSEMLSLYGSKTRQEIEPGYIQFRAINHERNAFAICSGVRIRPGKANVEHACIGSTSNNTAIPNEGDNCGDFAAQVQSPWLGTDWTVQPRLYNSVVMIFYR